MKKQFSLLLGSVSPRRKELLALFGIPFEVRPGNTNESRQPKESPADYVLRLALAKARANGQRSDAALVTADTTVALGSELLGKPKDAAEARCTLEKLRGKAHAVHSAVCLQTDGQELAGHCETTVCMRHYSSAELDDYIASEDWRDKAGGYAIQHLGFHPVEKIQGCHANVIGLPLCTLQNLFEAADLQGNRDIAAECQAYLRINCPVWQQIRGKHNEVA